MKRMSWLFRKLLSLRYTITVKGTKYLQTSDPVILLPNHVAYLDPLIVWSYCSTYKTVNPIATNEFVKNRWLGRFFRMMKTIGIDDIDNTGDTHENEHQITMALSQLKTAISERKNILLYPAGQLAGQGYEYLGGKRSAFLAIQAAGKNARILGIRTKGLWGSYRSNAWSGERPLIFRGIIKVLGSLIFNFLFFVPKRRVELEIVDITQKIKPFAKKGLVATNQALEDFYNIRGEEKITYVPYYFFYNNVKNRSFPSIIRNSVKNLKMTKKYDSSKFSSELLGDVIQRVKRIKKLSSKTQCSLETHLLLDLYFDSLDMAEIKNEILMEYPKASNTPITQLKTIGDLVAMASGEGVQENFDFPPCDWTQHPVSCTLKHWKVDTDQTILSLFRQQRKNDKHAPQLYDTLLGLQTRNDIVLKAFLISDYLKSIPGKWVGVMLPAVGSMSILLMAIYLAEKIPVMMNRTHPESAFDHCVKFSKTEKILTSRAFFNKIDIPWLKKYDFIFLEDLLQKIPLHRKIKALVKSLFFPLPKSVDPMAVILYTSGSESLPKAVPLTHKNIVSDIDGAIRTLKTLKGNEILFGFLPPFHSFGFTINTVFPLITGIRLVNTPDPNDTPTVVQLLHHTKATLLPSTPTFLKNILQIATKEDLNALKLLLIGAERCSPRIVEKAKVLMPKAKLLEAYGITECSPGIALIPTLKAKLGTGSVGKPLVNIDVVIKNEQTGDLCEADKEGMILVSGPIVFEGYLDADVASPFEEWNGKKWYRTGDLGYFDKDGYLYITGRKKRFLKLGGEMISLPFIENLLQQKYGSDDVTDIAVEGKETENGIVIVLFVVKQKISIEEVNHYLQMQGVSNLIRIHEIRQVDEIPLLGTGKTDYKLLKSQI